MTKDDFSKNTVDKLRRLKSACLKLNLTLNEMEGLSPIILDAWIVAISQDKIIPKNTTNMMQTSNRLWKRCLKKSNAYMTHI